MRQIKIKNADRSAKFEVQASVEKRHETVEVKIENSFLEFFPTDFKVIFPNLRKIYLSEINNLSAINKTFFPIVYERIRIVKISGYGSARGNLSEVNWTTFRNFPNIVKIDLRYNRIEYLEDYLFRNLTSLEFINFSGNLIQELNENLFSGNYKLKEIIFANNLIRTMPEKLFRNLMFLEKVDFGRNAITALPGNLFRDNRYVKEISFDDNEIYRMSSVTFINLNNLEQLDLEDNVCVNEGYFFAHGDLRKLKNDLEECFRNEQVRYRIKPNKVYFQY